MKGDSMMALKWATNGRVKGERAVNAAMAMWSLCMQHGLGLVGSIFL